MLVAEMPRYMAMTIQRKLNERATSKLATGECARDNAMQAHKNDGIERMRRRDVGVEAKGRQTATILLS